MKAIHLTLALLILFGASCTRQNNTVRPAVERKIPGEYRFEKVTLHDGFLSSDDVTGDYNNMILQLNDQHEAALIDQNQDITYFGNWQVYSKTVYYSDDDNGSQSNDEYTLMIDVQAGRGQAYSFHGKNAQINLHKIKFEVQRADGKYKYKLCKL